MGRVQPVQLFQRRQGVRRVLRVPGLKHRGVEFIVLAGGTFRGRQDIPDGQFFIGCCFQDILSPAPHAIPQPLNLPRRYARQVTQAGRRVGHAAQQRPQILLLLFGVFKFIPFLQKPFYISYKLAGRIHAGQVYRVFVSCAGEV